MQEKKKTLFSANAIAFLDNFGLSLVFIMFAPIILNPSYGFVSAQMSEGTKNILLGILIGVFPIFTFLGAPFWGDYGDRFGRKKAFMLTVFGTAIGHLLSALALFLESFSFLLFARVLTGFFSGNISICLATISDLSPNPKAKAHNFGILTVFLGAGWISAMLLGGYLSDPSISSFFSPVLPFSITALLTFSGLLLVRFWFTETHVKKKAVHFDLIKSFHEIKMALGHQKMRPFLFMLFFWALGWGFTYQWFTAVSLEQFHVSQQSASIYLFILGIIWMLSGVLLNPILVKKFSSPILSLSCIFCTGFFILLASVTSQYFLFGCFFWIATLTAPIATSNMLTIVSQSAPESIQGKVMGFTQSFQSVAWALIPLIGGVVAKIDIKFIFPSAVLSLCLSFLILLIKNRK